MLLLHVPFTCTILIPERSLPDAPIPLFTTTLPVHTVSSVSCRTMPLRWLPVTELPRTVQSRLPSIRTPFQPLSRTRLSATTVPQPPSTSMPVPRLVTTTLPTIVLSCGAPDTPLAFDQMPYPFPTHVLPTTELSCAPSSSPMPE